MPHGGDVTADQVAWARFLRSGLVTPFDAPVAVARTLLGVQSQFVPPAGLAIRNRLRTDFAEADLDRLLHEEKVLLRLWGQRNTVHVYDTEDWSTVVCACASLSTYRQRISDRLGRSEAEMERALDRMANILRDSERASRADLVAADPSLEEWLQWGNVPIVDLVRRGVACHAGTRGGRSYFAHRDRWLPGVPWGAVSPDEAARALAVRYFAAYGPATVRDFAFWLGARLTDARAWIAEVGDGLIERPSPGRERLLDTADADGSDDGVAPPRADWPVRLLHRFDPLLLAHRDKSWLVGDEHYKAVWRKAGYVEAVVLEGGRITGTWAYERKGRGITIRIAPFAVVGGVTASALEREAHRQAGYFEPETVDVVIE